MQTITRIAAGAAVAFSFSLTPAMADGMEKSKGYAAPAHHDHCDASKFGGFYAGIHGGSGTLTSTITDRDQFFVGQGQSAVLAFKETDSGLLVGGQIGYNWTRCKTVFGIEADIAWSGIDNNNDYRALATNPLSLQNDVNWLGSLRTKTGVAVGDLFLYVTGGIGFANIDTRLVSTGVANGSGFSSDGTRVGWVAGVGTEYAWSDRVRITGDLLYYDFGTETTLDNVRGRDRFDDHHSIWVSRIGINFKLGHDGGSAGHSMK